jgi:acyl carrier protein
MRGFRVELGEVETALAQHPTVAECVVITRPDPAGGNRLLAYVVPPAGKTAESRTLREHLTARLPEYMVPAAITVLASFPLTANGKLDRRALPDPDFGPDAAAITAPRTMAEEILVDMWCDVLALKQVGIHDNFFELGGHSLLATQVIARVHESLATEITMGQFFSAPTIASLARIVEDALIDEIKASSAEPAHLAADELVSVKE